MSTPSRTSGPDQKPDRDEHDRQRDRRARQSLRHGGDSDQDERNDRQCPVHFRPTDVVGVKARSEMQVQGSICRRANLFHGTQELLMARTYDAQACRATPGREPVGNEDPGAVGTQPLLGGSTASMQATCEAVPLWYRLLRPIRPGRPRAVTLGTRGRSGTHLHRPPGGWGRAVAGSNPVAPTRRRPPLTPVRRTGRGSKTARVQEPI